ncbi:MAG: twin-arginine translocase TatA/TatE family subunit [Gaiellales bacterium]
MPLGIFRNFGVWEILILLFVVLLFFGPKRLPEMGRSLGRGMREFKDSITGNNPNDEDEDEQATLTKAEAAAAPTAPAPAAKSEAEQASS